MRTFNIKIFMFVNFDLPEYVQVFTTVNHFEKYGRLRFVREIPPYKVNDDVVKVEILHIKPLSIYIHTCTVVSHMVISRGELHIITMTTMVNLSSGDDKPYVYPYMKHVCIYIHKCPTVIPAVMWRGIPRIITMTTTVNWSSSDGKRTDYLSTAFISAHQYSREFKNVFFVLAIVYHVIERGLAWYT